MVAGGGCGGGRWWLCLPAAGHTWDPGFPHQGQPCLHRCWCKGVLFTSVLPPAGTQMRRAGFHEEKYLAVHGERGQAPADSAVRQQSNLCSVFSPGEEPAVAGSCRLAAHPFCAASAHFWSSAEQLPPTFSTKIVMGDTHHFTKSVFKDLHHPVEEYCNLRLGG